MRILFLNHNIKGMGTYIRCFHFARHLVRFGHSVVILTSTPKYVLSSKKEIIDGVEVICHPDIMGKRIRNGGLGPIDTIFRCLFLLSRKFDVVENFDHRPAVLYPALVSKYILRIPLVSEWTDLHGTGGSLNNRPKILQHLIRPYEDFTERKSKKIPEKLIVISRWLGKRAIELGVPESGITYIPGGADLDTIISRPKKEVRKIFGLPLEKKIIAYTAGTHYDTEFFTKSVNIIQKTMKNVYLVTTGSILNNKYRQDLLYPERVIELGFLTYENYAAFLPCADVFIFPFTNKPLNTGRWPNKVGDYMAAGRPTVSNRTGDIIELFETHHIGLLALDTPEDFAEKTMELLSNEQLRFELGQNARKTAEIHYDWRLLSKKLETCLIDVAKRRKKECN